MPFLESFTFSRLSKINLVFRSFQYRFSRSYSDSQKIEFRSFPLDLAALNASKIAHCKNDGKSDILHFLYANQSKWVKGKTIEELNLNLKKIVDKENFEINFNECINNKTAEDHILQDRINGVKNYDVNSTPALIINDKKFDKTINYKNLKKTLEKML